MSHCRPYWASVKAKTVQKSGKSGCALLRAALTNQLCDPGQADEVHCASIFSSVNEKEWTREGISKTVGQKF